MYRRAIQWFFAIGLGLVTALPALAQYGVATVSFADSAVTRSRAGAPATAIINTALIAGDQISTASGRAEITFLDGAVAHLDRDTRVILSGDGFRLLHGRASLRAGGYKQYVADTSAAKLLVPAGSLVEISVMTEPEVLVQVISGVVRIETAIGAQRVADYHTAYVPGPGRLASVTRTASTPTDDFGRWTLVRTVMATSVALKGSEKDGGISLTTYYTSPPPSSAYYDSSYYGSSYYQTPYYGSSYYGTSYYTPYYSGVYYSQPYYATPYSYSNAYSYANSYRSFGDGSHRSPGHARRMGDFARPAHPIARPAPARGMSRGAIAVVPRR
jgi:hypothetical protein